MENPNFENDSVLFKLENGIFYGRYKVEEIDLDTAQEATRIRQQMVGSRSTPCIADISVVKRVPRETREFFSSPPAGRDLAALAIVINNPVTRTIGNFFLKFHQPEYPCKMFTDIDEATGWIGQFIQRQELCN